MRTAETSIYLESRQLEEGIGASIAESGVSLMRGKFYKLEEDLGEVSKMPLNIYKMRLALGVSRTWKDTLMEQLLGTREEPEAFELSTEEPIAKPSIKSRLLSNLVA